ETIAFRHQRLDRNGHRSAPDGDDDPAEHGLADAERTRRPCQAGAYRERPRARIDGRTHRRDDSGAERLAGRALTRGERDGIARTDPAAFGGRQIEDDVECMRVGYA